jgi:hypothetical protein
MRFNHMELSFARGTLTQEFRDDVDAFCVQHLLPVWFDDQCMEWATGMGPARRWQYA